MERTARDLKATSIGVAVACAAFVLAMGVRLAVEGTPHATSADSGMMAGLAPLFWVIQGGVVLAGAGLVAVLAALAGLVAVRSRNVLAGAATGAVAGIAVALAAPLVASEPGDAWTLGLWIGVPVTLGAIVAGCLAPSPVRKASWRDAGPASLSAAGEGARSALQRWLPDDLRTPDWRNARERWPLLLLLFTGLALFAIALQLAVPDLVPWGNRETWLAKAIYAGAMPWSKLATAWVIAREWQGDPFGPVAVVGAGLGLNGALLAGLLASLRRTVPVR
jgi:hypothetical protein